MDKHTVRHHIKKKRDRLQKERIIRYSALIFKNFKKTIPVTPGMSILAYISTQSEVKTSMLIKFLIKNGCSVYAPCVKGNNIAPTLINPGEAMKKGAYGILEPDGGKILRQYKKISLVLVPGIAFDRHGNRIGFGKGYYDRFLKKLPASTLKAALAFSCQVGDDFPAETHDVKMDIIITEKGVIRV